MNKLEQYLDKIKNDDRITIDLYQSDDKTSVIIYPKGWSDSWEDVMVAEFRGDTKSRKEQLTAFLPNITLALLG